MTIKKKNMEKLYFRGRMYIVWEHTIFHNLHLCN